jgi:hypothetical protein
LGMGICSRNEVHERSGPGEGATLTSAAIAGNVTWRPHRTDDRNRPLRRGFGNRRTAVTGTAATLIMTVLFLAEKRPVCQTRHAAHQFRQYSFTPRKVRR